jgi:hypothetical protein
VERKRQRDSIETPENLPPTIFPSPVTLPPTISPSPVTPLPPSTPTPSKKRRSSIVQAPVPDLMAPSAVQSSITLLPGAQTSAGKVISQTNRDIVANRKMLRMGGNPQTSPAVVENKSAAEALRAEMGLAPVSSLPVSAKSALKRKAGALEEEETRESDYSSPATPVPAPKTNGNTEEVKDTVRYIDS